MRSVYSMPGRLIVDEKITTRMCSGEAREEDADLLLSVANQIEGEQFVLLEKQQHGQRKVLLKSSETILSKKQKLRSVRKILFNLYNRDDFTH